MSRAVFFFFWCGEPLFVSSCTVQFALHVVSVIKTGEESKGMRVASCYGHTQSPL